MSSLTKLNSKCKECENKDSCTNKKLVACISGPNIEDNTKCMCRCNTEPRSQPVQIKCTPIIIKMGEYGNIHTTIEEITNKIKENLEKELRLGIHNCIR